MATTIKRFLAGAFGILLVLASASPAASQGDTTPPEVEIDLPLNGSTVPASGAVEIKGTSSDDVQVDRNKVLITNLDTGQYWTGTAWVSAWSWFEPSGTEQEWSTSLALSTGSYRAIAWTWDTSNNLGSYVVSNFSVGLDSEKPVVAIDLPANGEAIVGQVSISGTSQDNVSIERTKLLLRNQVTGEFWSGSSWVSNWSWFDVGLQTNSWAFSADLDPGSYRVWAWTWDSSGNRSAHVGLNFSVEGEDNINPTVEIIYPTQADSVSTGDVFIYGNSYDAVGIDRNRVLIQNLQTGQYWNGTNWSSTWSWNEPSFVETNESWFTAVLIVDEGMYKTIAWTWDHSNNMAAYDVQLFQVVF